MDLLQWRLRFKGWFLGWQHLNLELDSWINGIFLVPLKGGRFFLKSPNWQEKYHLYTTYSPCLRLGIICYRSHLLREPETTIEWKTIEILMQVASPQGGGRLDGIFFVSWIWGAGRVNSTTIWMHGLNGGCQPKNRGEISPQIIPFVHRVFPLFSPSILGVKSTTPIFWFNTHVLGDTLKNFDSVPEGSHPKWWWFSKGSVPRIFVL